MHGGFGGGGGGFGHSGGGGGGFGHSGHGHSSGHMSGGHDHVMGHDSNHAAHAAHHSHHAGGHDDNKGHKAVHAPNQGGHGQAQAHHSSGHAQGQGQSFLGHATGLVQNGHGFLGHLAAALSGHGAATGHGASVGHSMHMANYLNPLQAEKKDSSDQVGRPGALSHPDNMALNGMRSRRLHNEPRIILAAVFAGLLIWMLVVQVFSGGAPGRHKNVAATRPSIDQEMAQNPSVAPLLSILNMAEPHGRTLGIQQALSDDPNSDPNEATQTDKDIRDDDKDRAELSDEENAQKDSENSAQIATAMQIFQPQAMATAPEAAALPTSQPTMLPQAGRGGMSMRAVSRGGLAGGGGSARMTARQLGSQRTISNAAQPQAAARPSTQSNLLQAETLQKSAQETFAAGTFGGPRALASDEPIQVGAAPKVPGASSVLRVQQPGTQAAIADKPQPELIASSVPSNPSPAAFANLFAPGNVHAGDTQPTARRRWRSTPATAQHTVSTARNSTIADASIYTNSPVDELGRSRKRVLTDR